MADGPDKVRRVLHMKLRAVGDPKQMLALMQTATPFYRALGYQESAVYFRKVLR